jgi:hypothetical protein
VLLLKVSENAVDDLQLRMQMPITGVRFNSYKQNPKPKHGVDMSQTITDDLNKRPLSPYFSLLTFGSFHAVKNADMLRFRCTSELPEGPERPELARSDSLPVAKK